MGGLASSAMSFLGSAKGAMVLDSLGTGLKIGGSIVGGNEDAAAANYRAGLYDDAAISSRIAGNIREGQRKAETTRTVNTQKAAFAANGIDVDSAVVDDVTAATQFAGDVDAAMMHYDAMREAFGYDTSAALYRQSAKNAKREGWMSALGSIIGGASSLSSKWKAFQDAGAR